MKRKTTYKKIAKADKEMLDSLVKETMPYFTKEINPANGLIFDKTQPCSAASIAVVGLGLSCYVVGVERKLLTHEEGIKKTLIVLDFFEKGKQSEDADAMGYKGFYYHFLDMETGARAYECELSTIDTALFMAGVLTAANYFTKNTTDEKQIRSLADKLYRRVDWQWALNKTENICHGWKPEKGFLKSFWKTDYCEALLLYILALGSPTFPIPKECYEKWTATFKIKKLYNIEFLYAGPLFIHQLSHIWIDFKGIKDKFNAKAKFDYFENTRRATYVQQQYAIENKNGFNNYCGIFWGITASDGPGPSSKKINGITRKFYDYKARGVPFGPDDGTISPWVVAGSLPFAPEIVVDSLKHFIKELDLKKKSSYGFEASFNPTFPCKKKKNPNGWVSPWIYGLNQGPVILMIENFSSGLIWKVIKKCPHIIKGLHSAGFKGGWLSKKNTLKE